MARGYKLGRRLAGYAGGASLKGPSFRRLARVGTLGHNVTRASRLPILGVAPHATTRGLESLRKGGRFSRITAAKKGKYIAGGIVAAGAAGSIMNRRSSGLDKVQGRPTGPYVY